MRMKNGDRVGDLPHGPRKVICISPERQAEPPVPPQFYESLCHDNRRSLWSHHAGAYLACDRRNASGDRTLVHSPHRCHRSSLPVGCALALAPAGIVKAALHCVEELFVNDLAVDDFVDSYLVHREPSALRLESHIQLEGHREV